MKVDVQIAHALHFSESIPTTACIWDVASMKSHAIIVQQEPILAAYWNPKVSSMLAIFCEGGRAYIWQDELDSTNRSSVISINVPASKCATSSKSMQYFN